MNSSKMKPVSEFKILHSLLRVADIPFEMCKMPDSDENNDQSVLLYFGSFLDKPEGFNALLEPGRKCSVINNGQGSEKGLLEMIIEDETMMADLGLKEGDNHQGSLTAEEALNIIWRDCKKNPNIEIEEVDFKRAGNNEMKFTLINGVATIAPGIQTIPNFAFGDDQERKIKTIKIPEGVTKIEKLAFCGCAGLSKIVFPSSLKTIERLYLDMDAELCEVVIPEGVEVFEGFDGNINLKELHVPSTFKTIKAYSFHGCNIKKLIIEKGIETIEEGAFECNDFETVRIPGTVKTIGKEAFSLCETKKLILEEGIETIGESAFEYNDKIRTLRIPGSVKIIEKDAFVGCEIKNLILEKGIEMIEESAFAFNDIKVLRIPGTVKTIKKEAFKCCDIWKLTLEKGIERIEESAFSSNSMASEVRLPDSLQYLDEHAFDEGSILLKRI